MFAGMMIGAIGWGTCSDLVGRSAAFNATLFFTALFGILASFANSFGSLCVLLFFLGSAVGVSSPSSNVNTSLNLVQGSMPTDGTLLLEHMPKGKEYLVTALSVFFSLGSVLSALIALFILPGRSCSPKQPCSPSTGNNGWQYMLVCLGFTVSTVRHAEHRYPFLCTDAVHVPRPYSILPVARVTAVSRPCRSTSRSSRVPSTYLPFQWIRHYYRP